VDFSDAEFKKPDDLARARFDQPPQLTRIKRVVQEQPGDFLNSPAGHYTVTAVLLLTAAGLVVYALKIK
jgi:hypothetical protein